MKHTAWLKAEIRDTAGIFARLSFLAALFFIGLAAVTLALNTGWPFLATCFEAVFSLIMGLVHTLIWLLLCE